MARVDQHRVVEGQEFLSKRGVEHGGQFVRGDSHGGEQVGAADVADDKLGATRETVSFAILDLRKDGVIQTEGKRVILLDEDALNALVTG